MPAMVAVSIVARQTSLAYLPFSFNETRKRAAVGGHHANIQRAAYTCPAHQLRHAPPFARSETI